MSVLKSISVAVVLPASGQAVRMKSSIPKQFTELLDKPLFLFSVYCFHRLDWVDNIILTVGRESLCFVKDLIKQECLEKVTVVEGSTTRHKSIYAGIKEIPRVCPTAEVVLIHDAVRPLVDEEIIEQVATSAKLYGAAGVVRPLVSTVISRDESGFLQQSLDRNQFKASEMPQGFSYNLIKVAYEKSTDYDFEYGTECLHLVSQYTGTKAKLVDGPPSLWKVTYRKDLFAAEAMLTEKYIHVGIVGLCDGLASEFDCYLKSNALKCCLGEKHTELSSSATDLVLFHSYTEGDDLRETENLPELVAWLDMSESFVKRHTIICVYRIEENTNYYPVLDKFHKEFDSDNDVPENMIHIRILYKGDQSKLFDLMKNILWKPSQGMNRQVLVV